MLCPILSLLSLLIFARVIASWLPKPSGGVGHMVFEALERSTDIVLRPVRNMLPAVRLGNFGLDLSPLIVIVLLGVLTRAVC